MSNNVSEGEKAFNLSDLYRVVPGLGAKAVPTADPAPLLNVEPAKTTTATITSSATLSAVVAANEPAHVVPATVHNFGKGTTTQAEPVQAAARPTPVQSAPAPSADSGKGLHIDTESREILRYISQDFVLLGAQGKEVAYHIESGDMLNQKFFVKYCTKHYGDITIVNADGKEERAASGAIWWTWNDPMQRVVRRLVMEPTSKSEEEDNPEVFNLWYQRKKTMVAPDMTATFEDIKPLTDHLMYISDGDRVVVMFFLNWLATLYLRPDIKIPSGILMYSKKNGVGKSMLWHLLAAVFGPIMVGSCSGRALTKSFDDVTEHKRILMINEMARSEKADGYENFKNMISEEQVSFEGKGRAARDIVNITHYIVTTNNLDALPLMQGDRRIAVFMCNAEPKSDDYYTRLRAWMENEGPALVAGVLAQWKFDADWNPYAPVPQTEAAKTLQNASQGTLYIKLLEMKEARQPPFDKDAFTADQIAAVLEKSDKAKLWGCAVTSPAVGKALGKMGWEPWKGKVKYSHAKNSAPVQVYLMTPGDDWWWSKSPEARGAYLEGVGNLSLVQDQSGEVVNHE